MQTLPPTPISDPNITPFLADIISHINDEHTHDLRTIAEAKLGGLSQQIAVSVEQIYHHTVSGRALYVVPDSQLNIDWSLGSPAKLIKLRTPFINAPIATPTKIK